MRTIFDSKFQTDVVYISQGEYYISEKKEIVATTLGSCIAVCFYDELNKVGGMNHYMLPQPAVVEQSIELEKAKYGINSMEMVINEILKKGGDRRHFKAKIFGGANMFAKFTDVKNGVGEQNINFARVYLEMERIPLVNQDVGKDYARKIYFETNTGFVKLFKLGLEERQAIEDSEHEYRKKIITPAPEEKKITFF